ncbi:acyltransferase family protein [Serratia odorifera]|uniref:acyltransferase family protein n=1 Tax=Serratia odorifera TaxID=618 RepID=UPI0002ED8EAA|nr:acyltransferase [Serratia odorifera]
MNNKAGKVVFADQLRVLAFISVVITHWVGRFWEAQPVVAYLTKSPEIIGITPHYIDRLMPPVPWFDYGSFGVAVFFLISGFVIPFSLKNKKPARFIMARAVRIYPTYIFASLTMMLFIFMTSRFYWGAAPEFSFWNVLANLTLTQLIFDQRSMDAVNWTLSIEIVFYLFCAVFRGKILSGSVSLIFITSLTVCLLTYLSKGMPNTYSIGEFKLSPYGIKMCLLFMLFMSIGILFHYHLEQRINSRQLIIYSIALFAIVLVTWYIGPIADQFPNSPMSYAYALLLFSTCYALRDKFREFRVLSFLSSISYPYYALHSVIGYATLRILVDHNVGVAAAFFITFAFILLLSTLLHYTVEKPSIFLSKKIA